MSALRAKWKLVVPVLLLLGAALYMTVLKSPAGEAHKKVDGMVYVLPKEFVLNLKDGRFAKLTVGLVLPDGTISAAGEGAAPPPEGFGPLEQEAAVRDIVTNEVTGHRARDLISAAGRKRLKRTLLAAIRNHTDVPARGVLLTDVAVQ